MRGPPPTTFLRQQCRELLPRHTCDRIAVASRGSEPERGQPTGGQDGDAQRRACLSLARDSEGDETPKDRKDMGGSPSGSVAVLYTRCTVLCCDALCCAVGGGVGWSGGMGWGAVWGCGGVCAVRPVHWVRPSGPSGLSVPSGPRPALVRPCPVRPGPDGCLKNLRFH